MKDFWLGKTLHIYHPNLLDNSLEYVLNYFKMCGLEYRKIDQVRRDRPLVDQLCLDDVGFFTTQLYLAEQTTLFHYQLFSELQTFIDDDEWRSYVSNYYKYVIQNQ